MALGVPDNTPLPVREGAGGGSKRPVPDPFPALPLGGRGAFTANRTLLARPRGRALGGVMVAVALSCAGRGSAQSPQSAIPDELAVIAAACRENSARIASLQLSGTITATGAGFEGLWDPFADQIYNSQTREFSVWKDALNCRLDVTADREFGPTGEVIYNLPYAEHITSYAKLDREGGVEALKRKYGTPLSTKRTIVTPDQGYQYRPESNQVTLNIDPITVQALDERPEMQFPFNKTLVGDTMAEFVDKWAELAQRGDRSLEVTPLGEGQYRIRTAIPAPRLSCASELIVDLDQGGNVLSYIGWLDGQIVATGKFDYMNTGGAWVLAHAEVAWPIGPDGVPQVHSVYDVHPESVRINQPIDPQVFTFEGLAVRRGAYVWDNKTREEYLYDDVPLDVKAALALAREMEEELAQAAAETPQSPPPAQVGAPAPKPQPGQASPPAGAAALPTARPTSAPVARVDTAPTSRAAPPTDTRPTEAPVATRPVATRPAATRPVSVLQVAQPDNPTPPPPARRSFVPSPAVTAVVASAGCAAALVIGIWKLLRRGTPPRAG